MEERLTYLHDHSSLFSHDGIHDSQTHLASPALFYELLRRQVALSSRTNLSFSALKLTFTRIHLTDGAQQVNANDILRFSCELRNLTRSGDCIGRLGINECVVLISEGESAARALISRLHTAHELSNNESLKIELALVTSLPKESGLELLNRLDEMPLSTH